MDISDIHFHDSRLLRVVEDSESHDLMFEVEYPVDWYNNKFEPRMIVFFDVLNYCVKEGPFARSPTLLGADDMGMEGDYRKVTLQTNAGTRSLWYRSVDLRPLPAGGLGRGSGIPRNE